MQVDKFVYCAWASKAQLGEIISRIAFLNIIVFFFKKRKSYYVSGLLPSSDVSYNWFEEEKNLKNLDLN